MARADDPYDPILKPKHYNVHPAGFECIELARHLNFCLGNALKYIWRAGLKDGEHETKDLAKAIWYLQDEIAHGEVHIRASAARSELFDRILPHYNERVAEALRRLRDAANDPDLTRRRRDLGRAVAALTDEMVHRKEGSE